MTSLGDHWERVFGGRAEGERPTLREYLQAQRAEFGSNRAAARALGVNESVFRRALNGQTQHPRPGLVNAVERLNREMSARRITLGDIQIPVTERNPRRGKGGGRERTLKAQNLRITDPAAADRIRAAYVAGGGDAAAVQFLKEIQEPTGHYKSWLTPDELRHQLMDVPEMEGDYGYQVA